MLTVDAGGVIRPLPRLRDSFHKRPEDPQRRQETAASMTTDAPYRPQPPSIHVIRARKLLFGGLAGGLVAAVVSLAIFGIMFGTRGLVSAAIAAAMVLFFYVVGQLVMVMFADAGARTLMGVSMASYTARVAILGILLLTYNNNREMWPSVIPMAIFVSTVLVVLGWLAAELLVFSRLRIGIYDEPADSHSEHPDDQGGAAR